MTANPSFPANVAGISFDPATYPYLQPLPGDPWIVVSALQKAIRRGEMEMAERAALSVLRYRGNGLFRRLIVIAYEDVGIGAPDLLIDITRLCSNTTLRRELSDPGIVGRALVRALAAAPKDRSADYLIGSATSRTDWEPLREAAGRRSIESRIAMVKDNDLSVAARVTAAWYASGLESGDKHRIGAGDLAGLMHGFAEMGLAQDMIEAVHAAARATKEPIVLMLPLLMQELGRNEGAMPEPVPVPEACHAFGIPLYALDKHTRSGRQAIATFARQNSAVVEALQRHVPEFRHRDAAMLAAFYADAAPVALRLNWERADELEALGTETDLAWAGVPREGMADVLSAVRSNLRNLNEIRAQLLGARASRHEYRS